MPQNDINKTFKSNQFRHENTVQNELMTVEFRGSDPSDLSDNPMRMWARTDTGEVSYTVDGVNVNGLATRTQISDIGYSVKAFGAVGNGIVDDSDAFRSMFQYAADHIVDNGISSSKIGSVRLYIPPGIYLITDPDIMADPAVRAFGLTIGGGGRYSTAIIYRPVASGTYLFDNNDKWGGIKFSDMSFYGEVDANFMLSTSNGGAQNYIFDSVTFNTWDKVLELKGSDNNSEMSFYSCNYTGVIKKGLFVGSTSTSDQFLNYNFVNCNFEVSEGDFIDMAKGGNINVSGGSFIHTSSIAGTFFRLRGNVHSRGVQRILVEGIRVEHRNFANSKLIDCEWGSGNVTFISNDCSANEDGTSNTHVRAKFNAGNEAMPEITFYNCNLAGVHEYYYSVNSYSFVHRVKYEGCVLNSVVAGNNLADFITYVNVGAHANIGGKPQIVFENCRGITNSVAYLDTTFGFKESLGAMTTKKIATIKRAEGTQPFNTGSQTIRIPIGSIITRVQMFLEAGANSSISTTGVYTLKTGEGSPTTIATLTLTQISLGFNISQETMFVCSTKEKATLVLSANAGIDQALNGYFLVEYI